MILGISALAALFLVLCIICWAIAANQSTPMTWNGVGWALLAVFFVIWAVQNFGAPLIGS